VGCVCACVRVCVKNKKEQGVQASVFMCHFVSVRVFWLINLAALYTILLHPVFRSAGYSFVSHGNIPVTNNAFSSGSNGSTEGPSSSGLLKQHQPSMPGGYPHIVMPSPVPSSSFTDSHSAAVGDPDHKVSMLKARETFIQTQIEVTQFA